MVWIGKASHLLGMERHWWWRCRHMEWGEECEWDVKLYDRQMKTEMVQYGLPYCPLNIYFLPLRVENFIPIRIEGCSPKGSQPIKEEYGAFQRASSERFAWLVTGTIQVWLTDKFLSTTCESTSEILLLSTSYQLFTKEECCCSNLEWLIVVRLRSLREELD